METRANHLLIGSFVVGVIALTLACLIWMSKFGSEKDTALYDIAFSESVIGLSKGSVVTYNGVAVGEVVSLSIAPQDLSKVIVRIRLNNKELVRTDTEATLGFAAVTGVADIRLSGGSLDQPPLYQEGGDVPLMTSSPSAFAKLAASGQDIMVNINQVAARVGDMLSPENVAYVNKILGSVDGLVTSVHEERETIVMAIRELSSASAQLKTTLAGIDQAAISIKHLMDEQGAGLLESTTDTTERLNRLISQLDGLVAENRAAVNSFSNQGLRQVGPTLEELRATLAALQQLSDQLSRSDSALLGNPQPREFKTK